MTPATVGSLMLRSFLLGPNTNEKVDAIKRRVVTLLHRGPRVASSCFQCQHCNIERYPLLYCENTNTPCYMMPVNASFGCIYRVRRQWVNPASALSDKIVPLWPDTGGEGL